MRASRRAVIVAFVYLVFGVTWIVFSDLIAQRIAAGDPGFFEMLQTWKGLAFVVASTLVIFAFVTWYDTHDQERARRLDTVFASTSDAFAILDREWRVRYANPKANLFSGTADIVGMSVWEAFPEMVGTQFEVAYRQAMNERIETRAIDCLPGFGVWFEARGVPIPEGLAIFGRDVTTQVEAEQARAQAELRFQRFLDHNPMAAWVTDDEARVLWASAGYQREFGGAVDPVGRSLRDLFGDSGHDALWTSLATVRETGQPLVSAERLRRGEGEQGQYLVHRFPVDDEPPSWGFVAIDIAREVAAEAHAGRFGDEVGAAQLQEEMDAMVHAVSHDLRAPLRALTGFSEALQEEYGDAFDADGTRYLGRVYDAAVTMNRLIDGLLELSRVGRAPLAIGPVDLAALARDHVARLARAAPGRIVTVDLPESLMVDADPGLMRQALGHLIDNAWKFSSGRADARITMSVDASDGELAVLLSDNGVGFDMAHAGRLFAPFQRLHGVQEFDGVGIGLAVVRRIIRRHRGRVGIDSRLGEGTTVRFTLGGMRNG